MKYTFTDHLHNYAVWTAARAVQRRFSAKTGDIQSAIEKTELKSLLSKKWEPDEKEFDKLELLCDKDCFTVKDKQIIKRMSRQERSNYI